METKISIHALREEGDAAAVRRCAPLRYFYPRPPRGGRRAEAGTTPNAVLFLSTPSARRATLLSKSVHCGHSNFYPRPPRGGRPFHNPYTTFNLYFYPRPPRGGRRIMTDTASNRIHFYPRPPRGGRQKERARDPAHSENFYPRPPRGGRRSKYRMCRLQESFLSTPSARRATLLLFIVCIGRTFLSTPSARRATDTARCSSRRWRISIHALREEGDPSRPQIRARSSHFYPRPPRGGRPTGAQTLSPAWHFYPRPPRGGRLAQRIPVLEEKIFLSTPSARRATAKTEKNISAFVSL